MNFVSVGDLARSFQMRQQSSAMKQHLDVLTQELASGKKADWAVQTRGDYTSVAAIESDLSALSSFGNAVIEARVMAETMQGTLESLSSMTQDAGAALISSPKTGSPEGMSAVSADAKQKFLSAVGALNISVGGRFVMSGAATDSPALAGGQDILDQLATLTAGLTGAQDVADAVSSWFDAPAGGGGYLDTAYKGSEQKFGQIPISTRDSADLGVSAADPEIRDALKGLAMAALVSEGQFDGNSTEQGRLARLAGKHVLAGQAKIISVQARLGVQEELISRAETRNAAQTATLSVAKTAIAEADPYETATAIEAVRAQIETLYTITARLSRLNLTNFLS